MFPNLTLRVAAIASAALGILSVSAAHYIGFIGSLPPQVALLGGMHFAAGVTGTFLFFVVASLVSARIVAHGLIGSFLLIDLVFDRLVYRKGKTQFQSRRNDLSIYRRSLEAQGWRIPIAQAISFPIFLTWAYLRPPIASPNLTILLLTTIAVAGLLARVEFFLVWPQRYPHRLVRLWSARHGKRVRQEFGFGLIVLLVLGSYVAGQARIQHVLSLKPVEMSTARFSGTAQLVLKVGQQYLLRKSNYAGTHYIFIDEGTVVEIPNELLPVLPPIK